MFCRFVVCILIFMGIVISTSANDDIAVLPDIQEYVAFVNELSAEALNDASIYWTIQTELALRYLDFQHLPFAEVENIYHLLGQCLELPNTNQTFWLDSLVISWLETYAIDLATQSILEIGTIQAPVTAIDLNADGQAEWLVDMQAYELQGLVFIQQTDQGHYEPIANPLPCREFEYREYAEEPRTSFAIQSVTNLNLDEKPEIAILFMEQEEYFVSGRYYLLSWQDGNLVDVGDETLSFHQQNLQTEWVVENLDDDALLEIQQVREVRDNWDCFWTQTTIFDWDGMLFSPAHTTDYFPDTSICNLRLAEVAAWEYRYDDAIEKYEAILGSDANRSAIVSGGEMYIRFRLAMAHIMNDDLEYAVTILNAIQSQQPHYLPELIDHVLDAYTAAPSRASICLAAYDFIFLNGYYIDGNIYWDVGRVEDNIIYGQGMYIPPPAPARTAGCDAPYLVEELLNQREFHTNANPVEQLELIGIVPSASFNTDLNGDNLQDWLVYLPAHALAPIFFASDGAMYHVTRPSVSSGYSLNETNQLLVIALPDNAGTALLNIDYSDHYVPTHAGYGLGGGPGQCDANGTVTIWHFAENTLNTIFNSLLCEYLAPQAIVNNVHTVTEVNGWVFSDITYNYEPVRFQWDSAQKRFILSPDSQRRITPTPYPTTPAVLQVPSAHRLFVQGSHDEIIAAYHQIDSAPVENQDSTYWELQYWAAMVYVIREQFAEAEAIYATIYHRVPYSVWGQLAALHLGEKAP
jgi:hypothetical protein